jgi:hypothetical protein
MAFFVVNAEKTSNLTYVLCKTSWNVDMYLRTFCMWHKLFYINSALLTSSVMCYMNYKKRWWILNVKNFILGEFSRGKYS